MSHQSVMQKKSICYLEGQSNSEGSHDQNMIVSSISFDCWLICNQTGFMVIYYKPKCPVKKKNCCVQGQGDSKTSKCWSMFVRLISAEPFITDLGVVVHHREPECWFAVLKVKVTVRTHYNWNMTLLYPLNFWSFCNQTLLGWHIIFSWVVFWKGCIAVLWSRSEQISTFQWIFVWTISSQLLNLLQPNLVMVMHLHGPECHAKRLAWYLQSQGHS